MAVSAEADQLARRVEELQRQIDDLRRQISGRWTPESLPEGQVHLLLSRVGEDRMAFLVDTVDEVVMVARLARLPESPVWVPGVLNLRGGLIPVIDVQARLARTERRPELSDMIVVARVGDRHVGCLVQQVLGLTRARSAEVQHPAQEVACAPYLLGVVNAGDEPVMLLSVAALVAHSELPEVEAP